MEQILMDVCEEGVIDGFYSLNPDVERIDQIPFVDTSLHIATSVGQTQFAIEILSLKPSFGRKLNSDGHVETVKRLIKHDPQLIRVQGRERITPLHYIAETENINLLGEFLYACPASINDLTLRGETALHVAVKTSKLNCVLVLVEWLQRTNNREILKLKDENGNTVLHTDVSTNQLQIVNLLIKNMKNITEKNAQGLTALDIAMGLNIPGEQSREMKRVLGSAVAILIATDTYQALLSPPGGVTQGDSSLSNSTTTTAPRPGTVVLPKKYFNPIMYSVPLQLSLVFMMSSYMISLLAIFPPGKIAAYAVISSSMLIIYARFLGSMEYVPGYLAMIVLNCSEKLY
ncbi:hypothetical protein RND71_042673 [Anisodus tanguticus]|uniref:PGG domain-containing protein n=1 Tax=Anisodus tanguticus TaxID=243964 RepID=A0AAE1USH9_9SOLA|nr:hypothetical protein RND71_042673 [Anisodus tanguticus]